MASSIPEDPCHVAMDRTADSKEVASLVSFLARDESSSSTRAEFIPDGGETAARVANSQKKREDYPCIKRTRVGLLGEPPGAEANRVDPVLA